MAKEIPNALLNFLKTALDDVDDGYEYASELNRILNSDECQTSLSPKEIEALRDYADDVRKVGEINFYTRERIAEIKRDHFGTRGIPGYLKANHGKPEKPVWPF
jgi:predicted house-cleaning noncanonical NTP pyrophosphatase (MazG superfamily)